jgi:hypothetical protein
MPNLIDPVDHAARSALEVPLNKRRRRGEHAHRTDGETCGTAREEELEEPVRDDLRPAQN